MRICGEHFTLADYFPGEEKRNQLRPHAVPTQKLPVRPLDKALTSPVKRQREARETRAESRFNKKSRNLIAGEEVNCEEWFESNEEDPSLSNPEIEDLAISTEGLLYHKSTQANLVDERTQHILHEDGHSFADMVSENSNDKATQVHLNYVKNSETSAENPVNLAQILSSDAKLYTFTGIHTLEMLDALVECVSDIDVESSTNKKVLSLRDRIILTMVKIKMSISFTAIATLFGITRQTCANYFHSTCPLLSRVLEILIPWPEQEIIRCNLPLSFENFKKTRIILDCAETQIETCHCLKCRVLTYSQYKKKHTAKYCVGVAPSGLITSISHSFGGRASDKLIVNKSEILDKLEVNDAVMVDKGFSIETECLVVSIETECLVRHVKLIRPPFLRNRKKLSREDALKTADIARARVHVERVIQRLREFGMIKGPVEWNLAPYFDDCLIMRLV